MAWYTEGYNASTQWPKFSLTDPEDFRNDPPASLVYTIKQSSWSPCGNPFPNKPTRTGTFFHLAVTNRSALCSSYIT
jgi:hypothetical protein